MTFQTVLMIEDNQADTVLLERQIKKKWPEIRIISVTGLAKAHDVLLLQKIDLVLLDMNLPDGFGPKVVAEALSFIKDIPVIVITGMGTRFTIDEAMKYGAKGVIVKSDLMSAAFEETLGAYLEAN